MTVYLIEPFKEKEEQTVHQPKDEWIYKILDCDQWEIAEEFTEIDGQPAQMIVDENYMLTEKPFNEQASLLLEMARKGMPSPVFGAVLILTGADLFE